MKKIAVVLLGILLLSTSGCKVALTDPTEFTLTLYWTAPGDNEGDGTALEYDLRYSIQPITQASWFEATQIINGMPIPDTAGTSQQATFGFLAESDITIYFAIKSVDESNNWSELSNVVPYKTDDIIPPGKIIDLRYIE